MRAMKLLIADDNALMRALLRRMCAEVASETRECADGADAVLAFGEFQPDWTLMDIAMPRLDGLAATRQILAAHPGARVVVITQHRGPEYELAARSTGATAFLLKENLTSLPSLLSQQPNPSLKTP